MTFLLSSQNVFEYLISQKLFTLETQEQLQVELKIAKNFNLLLSLPDGNKLLVKQERHDRNGKTTGEFFYEWQIQQFFQQFSELNQIRHHLSEVLYFDAEHSVIIFNYLIDYHDLAEFYAKENVFPIAISTAIGEVLATIHRATFNQQEYQSFFSQKPEIVEVNQALNLTSGLERISPEIFGLIPADGLKFFALYQRYDSLGKAIAQLADTFDPCCLTHNDLKLNNILLHNDWEQASNNSIIRLIDWERSGWGDPAFDLGTIITSYLQFWLGSLVVSRSIDINESLRLAMIPLEKIQPSIAALVKAYFDNFPEILEQRPDFLKRVVQFSGLSLIHRIQAMLQYEKSFGNMGICMLQVAKSLLCRPEQSILTVFGITEAELLSKSMTSVV